MNTTGNNRYLETEKRITDAFTELLNIKDADEISVSDICKKSRISRPTFYAHYEDINDLFYKVEAEKSKKIKELLIVSEDSLSDKFTRYFEYLRENRLFYNAYFSMDSNSSLVTELMDSYKKRLPCRQAHSSDAHYHMLFFKAGIREIAAEWLKNGCLESPRYMAGLLSSYGSV